MKEQLKQTDPTNMYICSRECHLVGGCPVVLTLLTATKFEPSLIAQMLQLIKCNKVSFNHQLNYNMNILMLEVKKLKLKQAPFLENVSKIWEMEAADLDPCTNVLDGNLEPMNH